MSLRSFSIIFPNDGVGYSKVIGGLSSKLILKGISVNFDFRVIFLMVLNDFDFSKNPDPISALDSI